MPDIPNEGDRIRLAGPMHDDPDPVPVGTEGTVTYAAEINLGIMPTYVQIGMRWDDGRTLGLVCPPDKYDEIGEK